MCQQNRRRRTNVVKLTLVLLLLSWGLLSLCKQYSLIDENISIQQYVYNQLQRYLHLLWYPPAGLTMQAEFVLVSQQAFQDLIALTHSVSRLSLSLSRMLLRLTVFATPWLYSYTLMGWHSFAELEKATQLKVVLTTVGLLIVCKLWQRGYVTRTLDTINYVHYRAANILTFVGPYILIITLGYFPLKWWKLMSVRFHYIYTYSLLTLMILVSGKCLVEYTTLTSRDSSKPGRSNPTGSVIRSESSGSALQESPMLSSPLLVDRLKQLVTPRISSSTTPPKPCHADVKYRTSNTVVLYLSCWIGLGLYQLLSYPVDRLFSLVSLGYSTLNLWGYVLGDVAKAKGAATSGIIWTLFAVMEEVIFTVLFVAILARDTKIARQIRDLNASAFDLIITKLTGFSVRAEYCSELSEQDQLGEQSQWAKLAQLLPYGHIIQHFLENWITIKAVIIHFGPLLFIMLPNFILRYVVVVYSVLVPIAYSLRAAVNGNAGKSNYWLCYLVCMYSIVLMSSLMPMLAIRSLKLKFLCIATLQYALSQPLHITKMLQIPSQEPETARAGLPPTMEIESPDALKTFRERLSINTSHLYKTQENREAKRIKSTVTRSRSSTKSGSH